MPYKDKETRNAKSRERYATDPIAHENMLERSKAHNEAKRRASGAKKYVRHTDLPSYKDDPKAYAREYRANLRRGAVLALGGKCIVCGEEDDIVLQIDHVDGDGRADRHDNAGYAILRKIMDGDTGPYQVLCANDHIRKTRERGEHKSR